MTIEGGALNAAPVARVLVLLGAGAEPLGKVGTRLPSVPTEAAVFFVASVPELATEPAAFFAAPAIPSAEGTLTGE